MAKVISVGEFALHCEEMNGYCPKCCEFIETGDFEPDARNRMCDVCEESGAVGIEEALIMEILEISDAEDGD